MAVRLTFLVHASTAATATAAFPADEPLERRGTDRAAALRADVPRAVEHRTGAERACALTCAALGLDAAVDHGLDGWDAGRWRGRTLDDVAAAEPDAVAAWLSDPAAAPHGGESLADLLRRVGGWLDGRADGHTLAVCGPAVARAAVVVAMGAPAAAFWRVDAAPLTVTDLRGGPRRWTVRAIGRSLP